MKKATFSNNLGLENGYILLRKFFEDCSGYYDTVDGRNYHVGLNSLLDITEQNTEYTNNILTLAEGLSPRLLLMR